MSLLHADWKDVLTNPMLTYLDDRSRFATASGKFAEATAENSIKLLELTIKRFGSRNRSLLTVAASSGTTEAKNLQNSHSSVSTTIFIRSNAARGVHRPTASWRIFTDSTMQNHGDFLAMRDT